MKKGTRNIVKANQTLAMPGFSADMSLYSGSVHYRAAALNQGTRSRTVEPQMPAGPLGCYFRCLGLVGSEPGWSDICAYACTHGHGI
jgi:hypothetical protein